MAWFFGGVVVSSERRLPTISPENYPSPVRHRRRIGSCQIFGSSPRKIILLKFSASKSPRAGWTLSVGSPRGPPLIIRFSGQLNPDGRPFGDKHRPPGTQTNQLQAP